MRVCRAAPLFSASSCSISWQVWLCCAWSRPPEPKSDCQVPSHRRSQTVLLGASHDDTSQTSLSRLKLEQTDIRYKLIVVKMRKAEKIISCLSHGRGLALKLTNPCVISVISSHVFRDDKVFCVLSGSISCCAWSPYTTKINSGSIPQQKSHHEQHEKGPCSIGGSFTSCHRYTKAKIVCLYVTR